jgi:hypothetical protein
MSLVEDVERTLGFRLPSLMRRLYTEVGNGHFGPMWGLLRLRHLAPSLEAWLSDWLEQPWPTVRFDDPVALAASGAGT